MYKVQCFLVVGAVVVSHPQTLYSPIIKEVREEGLVKLIQKGLSMMGCSLSMA